MMDIDKMSYSSESIFERLKLIKICTRIAINKDMAVANNFLALNILNNTKIPHKNIREITAILMPIGKIKSLVLIKLSIKYRNGIKILNAIMVPNIPFPPNLITGKKTNHVNII